MFKLIPQDKVFFDLFESMATHTVSSAQHLRKLAQSFPDITASIQRIREEEHEADQLAHKALDRLDRTFITPFDREDIHALVSRVDDVVDRVQEIAETFLLYDVTAPTPAAKELAGILDAQAERLLEAFRRLDAMKDLEAPLRQVHELENQADGRSRAAIAGLFRDGIAAIEVIKWRDIYHYLEEAIDAAEDAAEVLERMYHKAT